MKPKYFSDSFKQYFPLVFSLLYQSGLTSESLCCEPKCPFKRKLLNSALNAVVFAVIFLDFNCKIKVDILDRVSS